MLVPSPSKPCFALPIRKQASLKYYFDSTKWVFSSIKNGYSLSPPNVNILLLTYSIVNYEIPFPFFRASRPEAGNNEFSRISKVKI